MIPAHSMKSIIQTLQNELKEPLITKQRLPKTDSTIGFMSPLQNSEEWKTIEVEEERMSKLVGILFCHPNNPLGKEEIVEHLNYFHHRSGNFVDFFCSGYGAYCEEYFPDSFKVTRVDDTPWFFSDKAFNEVRKGVEEITQWEFSGETDLILFSVRKLTSKNNELDFSNAISCNLEKMKSDKAFTSVRSFFESVFRFGENFSGPDPALKLSDKHGLEKGKNFLESCILSLLPENIQNLYKSAQHYAIKDISKK